MIQALHLLLRLWLAALPLNTTPASAQNFTASDPELQAAAEAARVRSAKYWSGQPLPGRWSVPCPVQWSRKTGQGSGLTCFRIQDGEVFDWRMTLCGQRDTVLSDVIPHEVDHTVRASLCRRPLPRWLDEGCASLMESEDSHAQLRRYRRNGTRKQIQIHTIDQLSYPESPSESTQLYAEGFSFVEYLLSLGSPQELLQVQRDCDPPSRSLTKVYRTELPQLLSQWDAWEAQRFSRGVRCDCVNCPWHKPVPKQPLLPKLDQTSSDAASASRPQLTVWSASWCGPCQRFHHDLLTHPTLRTQLETRFEMIEFDVDRATAAARQAGVSQVPVFMSPDRKVQGYQGPEWLLQQLGFDGVSHPATVAPPRVVPQLPMDQLPTLPDKPVTPVVPQEAPVSAPENQSSSTLWSRVVGLAPVALTVLTSMGVIGGSAVTGGMGGVALLLLLKFLQRRATRGDSNAANSAEGGVAIPARAPFPRKLDEAGELLGLRQSEGRVATLDALRGMFVDDELDKYKSDPDPEKRALIQKIRMALNARVDEVAPLTTQV